MQKQIPTKKEKEREDRPISPTGEKDVADKGCSKSDEGEGEEIMTIPSGLDPEAIQAIQLRKQDIRDQKANSGNVQIIERENGECVQKTIDHINRRRNDEAATMRIPSRSREGW